MTNFDEETHIYTIDGIEYPSVTDICSPISFKKLDAVNKYVVEQAADRGTRVHAYIQEYCLLDEYDLDEMDSDCIPYFVNFVEWRNTYFPEILFTEKQMFSKELGYCGTCDLLCKIDNEITLIDFKTTCSIDYKSLSVQLAGYSNLIKNSFYQGDLKTKVLQLKKNGYVYKDVEPNYEWFDILKKHNDFMRSKNGRK